MSTHVWRSGEYFTYSAAEAIRRIEDWFRRGYVMFSDLQTKSTHLRRVDQEEKQLSPRKDRGAGGE